MAHHDAPTSGGMLAKNEVIVPLTDIAVRNAKPGEKPIKLADGDGFHLYVTPAGGKLWRLGVLDPIVRTAVDLPLPPHARLVHHLAIGISIPKRYWSARAL